MQSSALTGYPEGLAIPDTPRWGGYASLNWKHELNSGLGLFGSIDDSYTGPRTDLPFGVSATLLNVNDVMVHLRGYQIANFRFGIKGEREGTSRWMATLFVNNFTDNHVLVDPQPQISLQTSAFARYVLNQPLTAGIDLSYTF